MVLTSKQKDQLNKDLLQYLVKNDYPKAAEAFAEEIEVSLADVDPEGNRLEIKWKSILTLQKKISTLEEENKNLKEELQKLPNKKPNQQHGIDELYLLKTPAKYDLKGHKGNVTSLAFHPQYTQLATAAEDGTIKIWEFQTGDFQRTLKGHTNPVNCVAYDNQGRYLASCSSDLTIKLWDLNNDYLCFKTLFGHNHNVSMVAFTPDGESVLSCSRDKTIKLWEVSSGYCKRTFSGHENWVRRIALSSDAQTFVSGSDDQSVIVWNISKEAPVLRFFAHDNVIEALHLIEGEQCSKLMASEFLKYKFTGEARINALKQLSEQGSEGLNNYYQTLLLTGGRDKLIKLFMLHTGQLLHTFFGHDNWVRSLSLHSSAKYLYSSADDKTIRVWDLNSGKQKKKYDAHEHFISAVKYNGKYGVVASSGNDMVVKIWHLKAV